MLVLVDTYLRFADILDMPFAYGSNGDACWNTIGQAPRILSRGMSRCPIAERCLMRRANELLDIDVIP